MTKSYYRGNSAFKRIVTKPLPRETELKLIKEAQSGNQKAMEWLITANLGFVMAMASTYRNDFGFEYEDLVVEGITGLHQAILDYKECGVKLMSYAVWWIRQRMSKANNEFTSVTVNGGTMNSIRSRNKKIRNHPLWKRYSQGRLHEMTTDELLSDEVDAALNMLSPELREYELDKPAATEASEAWLPPELWEHQDYESSVEGVEQIAKLESLLYMLSDRERDIVAHMYGAFGHPLMTLRETAAVHSISHERVRQIKDAAMKKLLRYAKQAHLTL